MWYYTRICILILLGENEDFIVVGSNQVNFSAAEAINGSVECISVTIIDDNDYEEFHEFSAELIPVSPENGFTVSENTTITIMDNTGT